jgi:hypothetical protein
MSPVIKNYQKLIQAVDRSFKGFKAKFRSHIKCGKGCSSCCTGFSELFRIEAEHIRYGIFKLDKVQLRTIRDSLTGSRSCCMLAGKDECCVYPFRPLICRTQGMVFRGAPVKEITGKGLDCCPLNFQGTDLGKIPDSFVLDMEPLEHTLARLNYSFCAEQGLDARRQGRVKFLPFVARMLDDCLDV